MITLNQWAGSFNEDEHRYFLGEKELQGITGMIKRMLFPQEYKGVSPEVLQMAAERGHKVHSQVELYDNMGVGSNIPEVANYARLKAQHNLECIASEYLVSDNEHYATAIDKVYHVVDAPNDEVVLGDIKTTYNFNREYVSWQLSIEAYFFEMLNPTLKVGSLIGIWLREDRTRGSIAKIIPVERRPTEVVRELIRCAVEGDEFTCERIPSYISEYLDRLVWLNEAIKTLTEEKDAIAKDILENMQKTDTDKIDTGVILFTRKAAATRSTFDSKAFKEEHADLYEQYVKKTTGTETIQIKVRE